MKLKAITLRIIVLLTIFILIFTACAQEVDPPGLRHKTIVGTVLSYQTSYDGIVVSIDHGLVEPIDVLITNSTLFTSLDIQNSILSLTTMIEIVVESEYLENSSTNVYPAILIAPKATTAPTDTTTTESALTKLNTP